jgi:putative membrane protein
MNYNYHFVGMDLIWWAICPIVLISFFYFFVSVSKKYAKKTPLDILRRRFSFGEISVNEYEQRKRFLEKEQDLQTRMFFVSSLSN